MTKYLFFPLIALACFVLVSCQGCKTDAGGGTSGGGTEETLIVPNMDKDSVYDFVQKQVDFGPRVPGTKAHEKCSIWFKKKLEEFGAKVTMQKFKATFHHGQTVDAVNVIGSINPEHKRRILLCAHWDSRYIADQDTERQGEAILGADDGGSGVAVLLEIARQIQQNPIDIGIDIVLFDAEDQGDADGEGDTSKTWCLGAQHWSRQPHVAGYRAKHGILLDMVGSEGARFTKEATSMRYAPGLMNKIWKLADDMGYKNYFEDIESPGITDDHLFVNQIAGIPTIDIINRTDTGFGKYWHTHDDDMGVISKRALSATGNVVLAHVCNEARGF